MTDTMKFVGTTALASPSKYGRMEADPARILDTALVGWFDAGGVDRRGILNASGLPIADGEAVASWACLRNSGVLTQTTSGSRPVYDADGMTGGIPCISFDGSDDRLILTGVPSTWPTGAAVGEVWGIVQCSSADADNQMRHMFGYGSNAALGARGLARRQASSQSRFSAAYTTAAGVTGIKPFLNVPMLVCAEYYLDSGTPYVGGSENGDALTPANIVFNTTTTVVVMGASIVSAAATWTPFKLNSAWVTNRRTTTPERQAFKAFAAGRGITGITGV